MKNSHHVHRCHHHHFHHCHRHHLHHCHRHHYLHHCHRCWSGLIIGYSQGNVICYNLYIYYILTYLKKNCVGIFFLSRASLHVSPSGKYSINCTTSSPHLKISPGSGAGLIAIASWFTTINVRYVD